MSDNRRSSFQTVIPTCEKLYCIQYIRKHRANTFDVCLGFFFLGGGGSRGAGLALLGPPCYREATLAALWRALVILQG